MVSRKDYALHYFDNGFIPIPLCWTKDGKCGCFYNHKESQDVGKIPLVSYKDIKITRDIVAHWFTRFPLANIGILLDRSNLLVVDADSEAAVEEVEKMFDMEFIPSVRTGRGKHYYYQTKTTTPNYRTTHKGVSKAIDIFSNGYMVAPPSVHANGHQYEWITPPKLTGLPIVPTEVEDLLAPEIKEHYDAPAEDDDNLDKALKEIKIRKINLDDLPINDFIKNIIKYGNASPYFKTRYPNRSDAIWGIMIICLKNGMTLEEIFNVLMDRRNVISSKVWEKSNPSRWLKKDLKRAVKFVKAKKIVVGERLHS